MCVSENLKYLSPYNKGMTTDSEERLMEYYDWLSSMPEEVGVWLESAPEEVNTKFKSLLKNLYDEEIEHQEIETSLNKSLRTHRFKGSERLGYVKYLDKISQDVIKLTNDQRKFNGKSRYVISCVFYKITPEEEKISNIGHFSTKNRVITESDDFKDRWPTVKKRLTTLIEEFQNMGSGWIFESVNFFDIYFNDFKPLRGSSYIVLPKFVANKKAVINPINRDQQCFKWCVTESVHPQERKCERITKKSKANSELFDWTGVQFPPR